MKPSRPISLPAGVRLRVPAMPASAGSLVARLRRHPIALPLLAAVLLHGLWLSHAHLRRGRQPIPAALTARDDTPELLRFSRRMPLEHEFATVPLPPAGVLPPPPPDLLQALPPQAGNRVATARGKHHPDPRRKGREISGNGKGSAAPASQGTRATTAGASAGGAATSAGAPTGSAETEGAMVALQRARRAATEGGESQAQAEGGGVTDLLRPQGDEATPYLKLWDGAVAAGEPPAALLDLPENVELRHLPLRQARLGGLAPSHRQAVLAGDRVLLFWIDGPTLWLLRSPLG